MQYTKCTKMRAEICAFCYLTKIHCARCTIPGSAKVENLCNFSLDKTWGLWYNGKRLRASARRPLIITDFVLFVNRHFAQKINCANCTIYSSSFNKFKISLYTLLDSPSFKYGRSSPLPPR